VSERSQKFREVSAKHQNQWRKVFGFSSINGTFTQIHLAFIINTFNLTTWVVRFFWEPYYWVQILLNGSKLQYFCKIDKDESLHDCFAILRYSKIYLLILEWVWCYLRRWM
jgi:hypothetical protein